MKKPPDNITRRGIDYLSKYIPAIISAWAPMLFGECGKGTPGVFVPNVKVAWEDYSGETKGFEIIY
jgi:hypothetical protein